MNTSLRRFVCLVCFIAAAPAWGQEEIAKEKAKEEKGILWYDIQLLPVEGKGWAETSATYDRLPAKAEKMVRPPVWGLSRDSAGMCVRFASNAGAIHARWTLKKSNLAMPHMPATGVSGLDLYAKTPEGKWHWLAVGRPTQVTNSVVLANVPAEQREYMLYLPLYNGVTSVEIGLPAAATLYQPPARTGATKPVVFYGTSITQGGCASRPGMVHTAILGRWLNCPVLNLGFSGNGKMEPEMASLLAELDPAVYVLDCLPNMNAAEVTERVEPFVKTLRAAHPHTPILLVEDRIYTDSFLVSARHERNEQNHQALQKVFAQLQSAKIPHLHYLSGDQLLGDDGEGTVDGSHPTDLGFYRQSQAFEKALAPLLKGQK